VDLVFVRHARPVRHDVVEGRADPGLPEEGRDHPGQVVVAVCHGGVINAYVGHILDIPMPLWFAPCYTGISRVAASRRGHRSVISLNETGHLRDGPG
jgi:broad specificity phosphatase PhoE